MYYHCAGHDSRPHGRVFPLITGLLFTFIAICFGIAALSFFLCKSKRDWLFLTLALGFTLWADYFLILHDRHLPGVAVFCFAHGAYILRATNKPPKFLLGLALLIPAFFWLDPIYVFTALYAALFVSNIYITARHLKHNRLLAVTGLLLFAACDVCVLIFNLPGYFGAPSWLRNIYPMIWVFYLPSQVILAISAIDFRFIKTLRPSAPSQAP